MAKKVKQVKGFYMNRKTGHPSYGFSQHYNEVKSIGFTHNKEDFSKKIKLKHNIDPKDRRACYAKTVIEIQKSNTYRKSESLKSFRIHKDDKVVIEKIIKTNKKRR